MNRPIKYRVWITSWGTNPEPPSEMVYIPDLYLHVYFGNWERGGYKDAVFQQYTGLKDRNGKEIYEGDIVEFLTEIHGHPTTDVVIYDEGQFQTRDTCDILFNALFHHSTEKEPLTLKVIGNIFENPELIQL